MLLFTLYIKSRELSLPVKQGWKWVSFLVMLRQAFTACLWGILPSALPLASERHAQLDLDQVIDLTIAEHSLPLFG